MERSKEDVLDELDAARKVIAELRERNLRYVGAIKALLKRGCEE